MTSFNVGYELLQNSIRPSSGVANAECIKLAPDRVMPISTMHRMALKAIEKVMLLMNNTQMLTRHHRVQSINDVLVYLTGNHEDQGLPGDRGDFYRRKLAEQLYIHYNIQNVDHTNVLVFVEGLLRLEHECRNLLANVGNNRSDPPPPVNVDGQILNIIGRMANLY